jgi:Spy/CpxP family protein refolding chaperone
MITRKLGLVAAATVISLAWAAGQVAAQPPEGAGDRGTRREFVPPVQAGGGARILLIDAVKNDLQLTTDQVEKIKDVMKSAREATRGAFPDLRGLSPEDRRAKLKEMREKMQTQAKESRKKIEAILTPAQLERFKQIRMQVTGPSAFGNPEVAKALDISKEQTEKIKALMEKMRGQWGERGGLRNLSPEERRKKLAELGEKITRDRSETLKAILEVLTPQQREKFDKLQGKKIELKPSDLMPAPGEAGFDLPARGPGK